MCRCQGLGQNGFSRSIGIKFALWFVHVFVCIYTQYPSDILYATVPSDFRPFTPLHINHETHKHKSSLCWLCVLTRPSSAPESYAERKNDEKITVGGREVAFGWLAG